MNHQEFVNCVDMPCCVMSVRKTAEGGCGEIRIIVANEAYKKAMGPAYYDNMLYSELVPQDNKFEDFCFRAAILKQRMHAYVETKALHSWVDQTLIPLASDRDDLGYCQFIFEFTEHAEADRMASVSINTAETVIRACIQLMAANKDFQSSVGDVLQVILEEADARGVRILLVDHEKKKAINFCDRASSDDWRYASPDMISYDLIRTWETMIGVSNAVIIKDEQDMEAMEKANPAWAQSLRGHRVRSLVLIPLRQGSRVIGYLYVINFDVKKIVEIKELIELMSFFLGSEIYIHLLVQKLEEISEIDPLTGINNRRAMIKKIRSLSERDPLSACGIINIDLNGLKTVNDNEGHEAGDRLIAQMGELLGKVFYREDIFRTGGDEFIVITDEIEKKTFERKIRRLRQDADKNGLSIALGSFWSDGSTDLTPAFRFADEAMYADKKAFYEKHPALRRKPGFYEREP